MSSAVCLNLDQSKILWSGNELTLSFLMTTQEAFVDSLDQDQTAHNVQSHPLNYTVHIFFSRL